MLYGRRRRSWTRLSAVVLVGTQILHPFDVCLLDLCYQLLLGISINT
jgi:hypothetical protein